MNMSESGETENTPRSRISLCMIQVSKCLLGYHGEIYQRTENYWQKKKQNENTKDKLNFGINIFYLGFILCGIVNLDVNCLGNILYDWETFWKVKCFKNY